MIQEAILKVVRGEDLAESEMERVMAFIADGSATPAQIGALATGLRLKGETVAEITGAARALKARSETIPYRRAKVSLDRDEINVDRETIVDTRGTGGGTRTFNVSTTTAFVAAGAGLRVAKHGARSVSNRCGSADVVEALGVNLDLTPGQVGACIERVGIGFLYSPLLQTALRHITVARREIGIRTIFNLMGPLTNPAGAQVQVLGVYRPELTEIVAQVLDRLGCWSAFVVYGEDSCDEISITGPSRITRLENGRITTFTLTPEEVGLKTARPAEIEGGDAAKNAAITLSVLKGEPGACRDMVLLNTAAVLIAAGKAETFEDGIEAAAEAIDSGRALEKLNLLIAMGLDSASRFKAAAG